MCPCGVERAHQLLRCVVAVQVLAYDASLTLLHSDDSADPPVMHIRCLRRDDDDDGVGVHFVDADLACVHELEHHMLNKVVRTRLHVCCVLRVWLAQS